VAPGDLVGGVLNMNFRLMGATDDHECRGEKKALALAFAFDDGEKALHTFNE
jgi:hypothetical protein